MYQELGVDTDAALSTLKKVPISMHCWQGDDVTGLDQEGLPHGRHPDDRKLSGEGTHTGRAHGGY